MPSTEEYEELIARMSEVQPRRDDREAEREGLNWKAVVAWFTQFQFAPRSDGPSLLLWSVGVTLACGAIGTFGGWLLGALVGTFHPGYYVAIFMAAEDPTFDPYEVGVGLGVTQGAGAGFGLGLALVALYYVYRYFMRKQTLKQLNAR